MVTEINRKAVENMAPSAPMVQQPEPRPVAPHEGGQVIHYIWSEEEWKIRPGHTASAGMKAVTPRPHLTH